MGFSAERALVSASALTHCKNLDRAREEGEGEDLAMSREDLAMSQGEGEDLAMSKGQRRRS